jgi:hypothetical protein
MHPLLKQARLFKRADFSKSWDQLVNTNSSAPIPDPAPRPYTSDLTPAPNAVARNRHSFDLSNKGTQFKDLDLESQNYLRQLSSKIPGSNPEINNTLLRSSVPQGVDYKTHLRNQVVNMGDKPLPVPQAAPKINTSAVEQWKQQRAAGQAAYVAPVPAVRPTPMAAPTPTPAPAPAPVPAAAPTAPPRPRPRPAAPMPSSFRPTR